MLTPSPTRLRFLVLSALVLAGCQRPVQSQSAGAPAGALDRAETALTTSRRTAITQAVEAASPAVVSINVIELRQVRVRDPFADFFGRRGSDRVYQQQVQGVGSGFVVSPDGYIVTNDHVAGQATKITVAFPDGSQLPATLVGSDPETDITLLKVDAREPLPHLRFDETHDPLVGEWAIAMGNPFGLFEAAEPSVTVGVVSAIGRDFPAQQGRIFRDMIQTDAAINSGNSGGPLLNALGQVIGMNTFIYSQSGGSVGIGFAVPAWRVRRVVAELRDGGQVDRSFYTGFTYRMVTDRMARALGLDAAVRGLIVSSVDANSPAERAGLQPYDLIVSIAGEPVSLNEDVRQRFVDNRAGDTVELGVLRDGEPLTVRVTLGTSG